MHIFILGGTGFIGTKLTHYLLNQGHQVTLAMRPGKASTVSHPSLQHVLWAPDQAPLPLAVDAIINIAGEPLNTKPWTPDRKALLLHSRVETSRLLAEWISKGYITAKVVINGSAMGIYGHQGDAPVTEDCPCTPPYDSFPAALAVKWEASIKSALMPLTDTGKLRLILLRTGIVLGDGGMMKALKPLYQLGLGGPMVPNSPWVPWIHIKDLVRLIEFILENDQIAGPINACSPEPARLNTLTRYFARSLKRPYVIMLPKLLLRLILGSRAELILNSQKGIPQKALDNGFQFNYANPAYAVSHVLES